MSAQDPDFLNLLARARANPHDKEATTTLYELCQPHLARPVRRLLNRRVRSKREEEDVTQSVWGIFYDRLAGRRFSGLTQLLGVLKGVARRRVRKLYRRFLCPARNVRRERPLGDVADNDPALVTFETPEKLASAREEWEQLLARQPADTRTILLLLRDGHTQAEAADRLGVSERTIQRSIHRFREESPPPPHNYTMNILIKSITRVRGWPLAVSRS